MFSGHTISFCLCQTLIMMVLAVPDSGATIYEVGPGKAHSDLSTIAWPSIKAGDEVRIFWRDEPYRSKIGLRCRGTADAPIKITGITNASGNRPVLSGTDATTPSSLLTFFQKQYTEGLGVIVIHPGPDDEWGYKPGYIEISGLKLEGGHRNYQYRAMDGQWRSYLDGAAGIWAVVVEHLAVRNCEFTDNGNGFFVLSKDSEAEVSRDILFEKNYVHGNGVADSDQEHNSYTQAAGITFQYNRYGPLRPGAMGTALKDRSANTVIRYNWIEGGSRTLDLVEPEDSWQVLLKEKGFNDTWVYGNILISEYSSTSAFATNLIHYGGDMGEIEIYRKGTLHFYYNTVYVRLNKLDQDRNGSSIWDFRFFDLSTNGETVILHNNIFFREGDADIYIGREYGNHVFAANNWINRGWLRGKEGFEGTVTVNSTPIEGESPGLRNPVGHDFSVSSTAAVRNRAADLPQDIITVHPLHMQYAIHQYGEERKKIDGAFELGALETGGSGLPGKNAAVPPLVELLLLQE